MNIKKVLTSIYLISYLLGSVPGLCQSDSLPAHHKIEVIIESIDYKDNRPYKVALRVIENPDAKVSLLKLDKNVSSLFRRYLPIKKGQAFRLRMSILTDNNGKETVTYEVIKKHEMINNKLSHAGVGEIIFGQTLNDYDDGLTYLNGLEGRCRYAENDKYPDFILMLEQNKVVRIDFKDWSQVIMDTPFYPLYLESLSYESWKGKNPQVEISPHEYQEGYYLTWWSDNNKNGIVAEYVNGQIIKLIAGLASHVTLVEGCS